jgi:hypothetical protein
MIFLNLSYSYNLDLEDERRRWLFFSFRDDFDDFWCRDLDFDLVLVLVLDLDRFEPLRRRTSPRLLEVDLVRVRVRDRVLERLR